LEDLPKAFCGNVSIKAPVEIQASRLTLPFEQRTILVDGEQGLDGPLSISRLHAVSALRLAQERGSFTSLRSDEDD
jgi:hypothetical protein